MGGEPPRARVIKAPAGLGQELALVAPAAVAIDLRRERRRKRLRRAGELGVFGVWFYVNPIGAVLFAVVSAWVERKLSADPAYRSLAFKLGQLERLYKAGKLRAAEQYIAELERETPAMFGEAGGILRLLSARVAWKRRDLRRAIERCDEAVLLARDAELGAPEILADAQLFRAMLLFEMGALDASDTQMRAVPPDVVDASPRLRAQRDALEAQLSRWRNAK